MSDGTLDGMKVAILVTDGFEQVEMTEPRKALDQAGAETQLVSPKDGPGAAPGNSPSGATSSRSTCPSTRPAPRTSTRCCCPAASSTPTSCGCAERRSPSRKAFFDAGKPVASICHGPWTVIETGAARGRRLASWPSLKTDIENAGARVGGPGGRGGRQPGHEPQARRHPGIQPRDDQRCSAACAAGRRRKRRPSDACHGGRRRRAARAAAARHGAAPVRPRAARGPGHRPGDLVHRRRGPTHRGRRPAPRPRPRHDPHRHRGDVRATPRTWSARRSPGGATRSSWSPRSSPATPPAAGRWRPASGRSRACGTDRLDCYLLHWRGAHPLEDTFAAFEQLRERGQDPVLGREQLRRARPRRGLESWRARAASPATRCSTTWRSARSSTPCSPGARTHGVAVVAYSPFGHGGFPGPAHAGAAACCRRSPARTRRDPAPGGAPVPGAAALAVHDPQGVQPRARRGERGGR